MKELQTPHDKVLWTLKSSGEMSISRLRQQAGLIKACLDIVLEELEGENRIVIKHGSAVLKN
jgi:hypothetical protein